jgi:hypothetical protein
VGFQHKSLCRRAFNIVISLFSLWGVSGYLWDQIYMFVLTNCLSVYDFSAEVVVEVVVCVCMLQRETR